MLLFLVRGRSIENLNHLLGWRWRIQCRIDGSLEVVLVLSQDLTGGAYILQLQNVQKGSFLGRIVHEMNAMVDRESNNAMKVRREKGNPECDMYQ